MLNKNSTWSQFNIEHKQSMENQYKNLGWSLNSKIINRNGSSSLNSSAGKNAIQNYEN